MVKKKKTIKTKTINVCLHREVEQCEYACVNVVVPLAWLEGHSLTEEGKRRIAEAADKAEINWEPSDVLAERCFIEPEVEEVSEASAEAETLEIDI